MTDSSIKLEVSEEARDQVRGLIKSQKAGTAVRVFVQSGGGGGCGGGCGSGSEGGGCGCGSGGGHGGPAFAMAFDQVRNGDQIISENGFKIVVDDLSAELLNGARIDYVTGFKITPPGTPSGGHGGHEESAGGCGCGSGGCGCG
jgi:Fe-S cluster assembly iron-binding protein IscA